MVTIIGAALLLLGLGIGWHEHMQGKFGQLKRELKGPAPATAPPPFQPGGQDPVVLERSTLEGGSAPELLSATLLPGRGMNLFQIKAYIPGKGEVNLLASPSLADAADRLTGENEDANGRQSLLMGGALEAPWSGAIFGNGDNSVTATWNGRSIKLPAEHVNGVSVANGGLLLKAGASTSKMTVMPDGGELDTTYNVEDFDGRWPSKTQITSTAQLSGHLIELKISARNNGSDPEPIGLGWQPRFAILNKNRENILLHIPSTTRIEKNPRTGEPTGRLLPVDGTPYDFTGRVAGKLDRGTLDETFVNPRQAPLDNGPVIELRDPENNYGLRMTILSPSIKAVHVSAPADGDYISISPRFNYDDPFGREWGRDIDTGMVVLQPGQSAQWRVRLEIFSLTPSGAL